MEFYPPDGGEIRFLGERIDGLTPDAVARAGINRTYQNIRLFGNITAIENILVGMHLHLRSTWWGAILNTRATREDEQRGLDEAYELLKFVELAGRGDIYARNLSYGEQRRLEVGRALATRPRLLMLDEPMAGMNPRESNDMMDFVRRVRDEMDITILLIEHQMRVWRRGRSCSKARGGSCWRTTRCSGRIWGRPEAALHSASDATRFLFFGHDGATSGPRARRRCIVMSTNISCLRLALRVSGGVDMAVSVRFPTTASTKGRVILPRAIRRMNH